MAITQRKLEFDPYILESGKSSHFCFLTHSDSELRKAIEFLNQFTISHPISKSAVSLLSAVQHFKYATTQDPEFVSLRFESKSPEELKKTLDDVSDKLHAAEMLLNKLNESSDDHQFLESIIQYCIETICLQLEEMAENADIIYEKYFPDSTLKKLLA